MEVLVAFAILSVSLTAILRSYSMAMGSTELAERYTIAALFAESKLEAIGVEQPLEAGEQNGEWADGFRWRTLVSPLSDASPSAASSGTSQPFSVEVVVEWGDPDRPRAVSLQSYRVGPHD